MGRLIAILIWGSALLAASGAGVHADRLPLGDGNVSSAPRAGYVYACQTQFGGGGAHRRGEWIGAESWDPAGKPVVDGAIDWPDARITIAVERDSRVVRANNLPAHPTGRFPIDRGDDAYEYDRNPNSIRPQDILLRLPAVPLMAAEAACVPMGMVAFALTGAAIYNALDAMGRDAPAHEIQDACDGHPQRSGQYHYHDGGPCMADTRSGAGGHSDLAGYALDGFGLYGLYGDGGRVLSNADLDACHGHAHTLDWDGARRGLYHYHLTPEYPYTIGCFRGAVERASLGNPAGSRPPEGAPPPGGNRGEAILRVAAEALGVSVDALRDAVGPPPPDFARAARVLGLDEQAVRRAMHEARLQAGGQGN